MYNISCPNADINCKIQIFKLSKTWCQLLESKNDFDVTKYVRSIVQLTIKNGKIESSGLF